MKLAFALLLSLVPALVWAQTPAGQPVIRTTIDPDQGIVIGQPVRLNVEVLFPGEMLHPPRVNVPEAPGAQILRFETQATTTRDRIGDQDYVGQSFEFVLFPRRGGEIAVPAPNVTLLDRSGEAMGQAKGEAMRIAVTVPPGIDQSGPVLAADRVSVEQNWSPDPHGAQLKPGAALVRLIRRQADGVPALGMAEFSFTAPEGVRVYVDPPVVEDRSNRGVVEGHRTDKATYVFEKSGTYDLPALSQPWWSLSGKQARTETLPGVKITVAAAAVGRQDAGGVRGLTPAWLVAGLILAVLLLALILFRAQVAALWRQAQLRHRSSEAAARRELVKTAGTGDAPATYHALAHWLERLPVDERRRARADGVLGSTIAALERSLFAADTEWERTAGAKLAAAANNFHRQHRSSAQGVADPLPPLNPVG